MFTVNVILFKTFEHAVSPEEMQISRITTSTIDIARFPIVSAIVRACSRSQGRCHHFSACAGVSFFTEAEKVSYFTAGSALFFFSCKPKQ